MRGREVADPGAGPHRPDAADAAHHPGRLTHDYVRHGTTSLFAALDIATGSGHRPALTAATATRSSCVSSRPSTPPCPRSWTCTWSGQLRHPQDPGDQDLAAAPPSLPPALHPDLRLLAQPGRALVRRADQPQTPPLSPPQRRRAGSRHPRLDQAWNDDPKPFVWTKTADEILDTLAATAHELTTQDTRFRVDVQVLEGPLSRCRPPGARVWTAAHSASSSGPRGELASYAFGWTTGSEPHVARLSIGIGAGNPGGGTFHAVVFEHEDGHAFSLIDEPFERVPQGGPDLTADQARAHEDLPFVWWVADHVMEHDRRAWWMRHWLLGTTASRPSRSSSVANPFCWLATRPTTGSGNSSARRAQTAAPARSDTSTTPWTKIRP